MPRTALLWLVLVGGGTPSLAASCSEGSVWLGADRLQADWQRARARWDALGPSRSRYTLEILNASEGARTSETQVPDEAVQPGSRATRPTFGTVEGLLDAVEFFIGRVREDRCFAVQVVYSLRYGSPPYVFVTGRQLGVDHRVVMRVLSFDGD